MSSPASASQPASAVHPASGGALAARDIHVTLQGRAVLRGVSLTARGGEVVGVIGPNGAGKSTLLRALAGLVPLRSGAVTLDTRDLASWPRPELARRLAYLPQDRVVHWPLSARAVVALGRLPHAGTATAAHDAAEIAAAMQAMDVAGLADRPVTELSGGERARVLVARALAQGGGTIIADEPTAGLDPAHTIGLFVHLSRLAGDAVRAGVALGVSPAHLGWSRRGRLQALWPAWVLAALMGAMVFLADGALPARGPAPHLAFMIAIGVIAYATLVSLFAKTMFQTLKSHLAQASAPLMRKFAR